MEYRYLLDRETLIVQVDRTDSGLTVTLKGRVYTLTAAASPARPGEYALTLDGQHVLAWVAADGARRWVALAGAASAPVALTVPQSSGRARQGAGRPADVLEAQMPGVVRRVLVAEGDAVERGQVLVMMEAMKMEIRVSAPHTGTVTKVAVAEGQVVERGAVLVELTTAAAGEGSAAGA
jgi:biotin carboxyl carrier protein